ncbi:MAG: hypothetical protein H0U13_04750 [Gemmatimonadaceae bacterium]|nr:hypothetical protein [Gemmatimonadaceae bacterium]
MRRLALWLLLTGLAVIVGFGLAWVVLGALGLILPPFQYPDDDDTIRDYGPVLAAYATWGMTSLVGSALAWRWLRSRDIARR